MNGPGDLPLQHYSGTPDANNCSIISIIPTLGMSSCRGRAEAFARRLSSKLRTLGSQADDSENSGDEQPIINGEPKNTWVSGHDGGQTVTDLQPLRHESDSFFDFDCELESPGSPVDECEYLRLIESTSNTPHNSAAESGYACASAASSHSSSDGPYFDVNSESESSQQQKAHLCQPHQKEGTDEVDFPRAKAINDGIALPVCNGHACELFTKPLKIPTGNEEGKPQHTYKDVSKPLPSEGPDIEKNHTVQENKNLQEEILKELQQQSQNVTEHEKDEKDTTSSTTAAQETSEPNTEQQAVEQHILVNGHAENGEEVLKIEICQEETTAEDTKEPTVSQEVSAEGTETQSETIDTQKQLLNSSHLDTTDDEEDCRPQRVKRCSSLKTGKTPPGTPGRKKIVRFADVLGLDLADVKTFLNEIPNIPKSAFEDLEINENEPPIQLGPKTDKLLMPLFQQPGGLPNFLDIVKDKQVSLENAAVTDHINHTITGSVRVRNLDFHKSVHIRYTLDNWRSYADLQANYVENTCDGFSDKFSFVLFGNSLHVGQRLEFAVRFQCKGQQYWDNNYGSNYCFQCLPTSTPTITPPAMPSHHTNNSHLVGILSPVAGDAWCTSFY
ncbi:glycogen-binding subunit 76A-like [Musca vetustissima]|uniref:glycogen-binding subunit 76A-like n=1 Tax=Musca vetustissima TaxID=27455 RepID=UPI002AB732C4|nr:glycogen-binding subunit 76A-like [Musca vetustissima]